MPVAAGREVHPQGCDPDGVIWFNMACYPVYVGFTMSSKALAKVERFMGQLGDGDVAPSGGAACTRLVRPGMPMVLIISAAPRKLPRNVRAASIAHEATHAADFIFERIGEEHPALEQRAYLVQQLVQDSLYAMDALRRGL